MEKLSMKTMDIAFQAAGKTKAPNQTGDVSGDYDFRKMLQSKDEDAMWGLFILCSSSKEPETMLK